jgi:hypothetical protein
MSGIYIPGLRVPEENEDELWIAVRYDGTVTFNAEWGWTMNKGKAVSVPPHGRLGDLDALEAKCTDEKGSYFSYEAAIIGEAVSSAPTIIPASKEAEK